MTLKLSIADIERRLSPKQAARVKYRTLVMRRADPEGAAYMDRVLANDAYHHWFLFCLGAVARRE